MNIPPPAPETSNPKLKWYELVWVGWPIALLAVGGAIGGACGGAAWALNQKIFHRTKHPLLRYLWTGLISIAAIIAYLIIATIFLSIFQKSS